MLRNSEQILTRDIAARYSRMNLFLIVFFAAMVVGILIKITPSREES